MLTSAGAAEPTATAPVSGSASPLARTVEVEIHASDLPRLVGFRVRNHFCSHVDVIREDLRDAAAAGGGHSGAGAAPRSQRFSLCDAPHSIRRGQDAFDLDLSADMRAMPTTRGLHVVQFKLCARQASPAWVHLGPQLASVETRWQPEASKEGAGAQQTATDESSLPRSAEVRRVQIASDQLALHLGVLEGLRMRRSRAAQDLA